MNAPVEELIRDLATLTEKLKQAKPMRCQARSDYPKPHGGGCTGTAICNNKAGNFDGEKWLCDDHFKE